MVFTLTAFLETWEKEAESTQRVLDALTDSSLSQVFTYAIAYTGFRIRI
ncbi:hypothetical protein JCM17380_18200 [Desulfosporosinus burensis]